MLNNSRNELLQEIRDILKITQENQKDIIDLREQGMLLQKEVMAMAIRLERNEERAKTDDGVLFSAVKDHTAEHFIARSEFDKELETIYKSINGVEKRLETEVSHKVQLFMVGWTTASILLGTAMYLFDQVESIVWK